MAVKGAKDLIIGVALAAPASPCSTCCSQMQMSVRRTAHIEEDARHWLTAGRDSSIGILGLAMVGKLDLQSFRDMLAKAQPPAGLSPALQALWWDAKGDWDKAHKGAQERNDTAGMRVHAYLHRKEGDQPNAEYWYRRCGAAPSNSTLDEEWEALVRALLEE